MKRRIGRLAQAAMAIGLASAIVGFAVAVPEPAAATDPSTELRRSFAQPSLLGPSAYSKDSPEAISPRSAATLSLRPSQVDADPKAALPAPVIASPVEAVPVQSQPQPQPVLRPAGVASVPVTPSPPDWPRVLPAHNAEPMPDVFSAEQIAAGRAQCAALLRGLDVVVIEEAPIKTGSCGTPAPVQLISLGRNPQVAMSPPMTMTCDMVAALHKWITKDLQPLAKKHLASSIIGVETMSSYSCRNAYGRKRGNLSEHGRANAVDIRGFHTADAQQTTVLAGWGPTGWEIRAQVAAAAKAAAAAKIAAEKAAAAKAAQEMASKSVAGPVPSATAAADAPPAGAGTPVTARASAAPSIGSVVEGLPSIASRLPGASQAAEGRNGYGWTKPSQLGGPKVPAAKAETVTGSLGPIPNGVDSVALGQKAKFLREAHASACRIFGTTLGPETNLAHKNHFHVDMAERPTLKNICE